MGCGGCGGHRHHRSLSLRGEGVGARDDGIGAPRLASIERRLLGDDRHEQYSEAAGLHPLRLPALAARVAVPIEGVHAEVGGLPRGAAIEALALEPTEARVHPSCAGDHREARALELAAVLARDHHLVRAGPPEGKRAVVGAVSLVHHHAPLLQRTLPPSLLPQEVRHILLFRRIALGRPTLWLKQSRHAREGVPRRGEGRVVGCMARLVAREYAEAERESRGDARELRGSSDEARA